MHAHLQRHIHTLIRAILPSLLHWNGCCDGVVFSLSQFRLTLPPSFLYQLASLLSFFYHLSKQRPWRALHASYASYACIFGNQVIIFEEQLLA